MPTEITTRYAIEHQVDDEVNVQTKDTVWTPSFGKIQLGVSDDIRHDFWFSLRARYIFQDFANKLFIHIKEQQRAERGITNTG